MDAALGTRLHVASDCAGDTEVTRALPAWLWPGCLLGALPVAWAAARGGYGWLIADPWRDLAVLVLGAVTEEIVFRGGLQRALRRWGPLAGRAGPVSAANALTSAVFAAAHLWQHPPLAALGVLPVSLLLGWVYERGDERLAPPIALHLYFNLALYACSFALARGA